MQTHLRTPTRTHYNSLIHLLKRTRSRLRTLMRTHYNLQIH